MHDIKNNWMNKARFVEFLNSILKYFWHSVSKEGAKGLWDMWHFFNTTKHSSFLQMCLLNFIRKEHLEYLF